MISFGSDYAEGCHPSILELLTKTNFEQSPGYGEDEYCARARRLIAQKCACEHADVHFLVGGTQTNLIAISSVLRPCEGVVAADEGHIATHETGAIEATGHKVLTLPSVQGKITGEQVEQCLSFHFNHFNIEHMVWPGMVYISQPTECGTMYTLRELEEISAAAHRHGLPLFVDGARLGYGLTAPGKIGSAHA